MNGFRVAGRAGKVLTGFLRDDSLFPLSEREEVLYIEGTRRVVPMLDLSTSDATDGGAPLHFVGCNVPRATGFPDGTGVIVGVVDTGIDWRHLDFVDESANPPTSRILLLWDQTDPGGPTPSGLDYGTEWRQDDINDELDGSPAGVVRETDAADSDAPGHGTHVTGIAAGDGSATDGDLPPGTFAGVAPGAAIIFVKTDFTDVGVIDGVNYILQRAQALGRPVVVNLSLGSHEGSHDGTSNFEAAISSLVGPGRILVNSAGNSRGSRDHAESAIPQGGTVEVAIQITGATAYVDLWHTGGDAYLAELTAPESVGFILSADYSNTASGNIGDASVTIYNAVTDPPNGDEEIFVSWEGLDASRQGTWTLELSRTVSAGDGEWDAWCIEDARFGSRYSDGELVVEPANAENVIAVGASIGRKTWVDRNGITRTELILPGNIASFSSPGPTRDTVARPGRLKPDITAPGQNIFAAMASGVSFGSSDVSVDDRHRRGTGTSMSAPHVTGAVALLLGEHPDLTPEEALAMLRSTARVDGYVGSIPNTLWGWGKMNVLPLVSRSMAGVDDSVWLGLE